MNLLTKYVEPAYFEETKSGNIKLGTLREYRKYEKSGDVRPCDSEARLSDYEEGILRYQVEGELTNADLTLGGISFKNLTVRAAPGTGPINSAVADFVHDAIVFCTSIGGHSKSNHEKFLARNKCCTHFVIFDRSKLAIAMYNFARTIPNAKMKIVHDHVEYSGRGISVSPSEIGKLTASGALAGDSLFLRTLSSCWFSQGSDCQRRVKNLLRTARRCRQSG